KAPRKKRQREEEEEEDKGYKPKRNTVARPDGEAPKRLPEPVPPATSPGGDLRLAAKQARHFAARQLFLALATPRDVVTFRDFGRVTPAAQHPRVKTVKPVPAYVGNNPGGLRDSLLLTPLAPDGRPLRATEKASPGTIESVRHYEQLAQDEVRKFLDK